MTRFRQIYNLWGVYAGPAPAYSGHYSDYNNEKHNRSDLTIFDNNLLRQIDRVTAFEYGFNIDRNNVTQLGTRSLVDRFIVNRPSVQVNFNYWMVGLRNEVRLGFVVNYQDITGNPILGNQEICCFKNFTGQQTDFRNLFLAVKPDFGDLNEQITDQFTPLDNTPGIDPSGLFVFGFGNCYINSYRIHAAVGELPSTNVGYICDNVMGYSSGSGANIPAVFPKTGNLVDGMTFTIPRAESIVSPSVITPGNINLQIGNLGFTPDNVYNYINLFNTETSLYNQVVLSGDIGSETLVIGTGYGYSGNQFNFSGIYLYNVTTNNYNLIFATGIDELQSLIIFSGVTGVSGPNVFNSLYLKNVSNPSFARINATGNINEESIILYDPISALSFNSISDALFGISSSGVAIESFDLSINLEREDLRSIGYVLPVDRRINFPILAELNLSAIVGDNHSGSLVNILNRNQSYDLLINMYNSCTRDIAIQYKIKNAKLQSTNYGYSIGNKLIANFGFMAEIDVDNPFKGLFISGLLNMPVPEFPYDFLLLQPNETGFLLTQDNNLLITRDKTLIV